MYMYKIYIFIQTLNWLFKTLIKAEHICTTLIPVVCLGTRYKYCKLVKNSPSWDYIIGVHEQPQNNDSFVLTSGKEAQCYC